MLGTKYNMMNKPFNLLLIFAVVFFTQCNNQSKDYKLAINSNQKEKLLKNQYLNEKIITDSFNIPIDSNVFYFPMPCFESERYIGADTFVNRWYSKMLFALKEPLLYNKNRNNIVFRFTMLRTFHNPIALRIERENNKFKLNWKKSNGAGGYEPGILCLNKEKDITEKEWRKFIELINKSEFWNLPSVEKERGVLDGSEWILEGSSDEYYHVVSRCTPRDGGFYGCCNYLLSLTDLKFDEKDKKY